MHRFLLTTAILLSALSAGEAASKRAKAGPAPIPSRTWSCYSAGGLIDGSCVALDDDMAIIEQAGGERVSVPIELFEPGQQKEIRQHFGAAVEDKKRRQPSFQGHPWHSSRGGVIVSGKITGRTGNLLTVEDGNGDKFRIPYNLLASGAQDHARAAVTQLEGKPFQPEAKTKPAAKPRATPERPSRPVRPVQPELPVRPEVKPPIAPEPPAVVPVPEPATPKPSVARPAEQPVAKPTGPARKWKMRGGAVLGEGRFVELRGDQVTIEQADGKRKPLPLPILDEADQEYARTLAKGGTPGEVPAGAIEVRESGARLSWSLDRRSMRLLDGRKLVELSADGKKAMATHGLSAETLVVLERPEYFVAACGKELRILDKTTLKTKAKHELWKYKRIRDVALHPSQKVAFVSVEGNVDEVRDNSAETQRIVIVDEASGDVALPDNAYGAWVVVHPSGKFLLAGFRDVYQTGSDIHVNPDLHVVETPQYGNTDILRRFKIEGNDLALDDAFKNAGANGQGLVMSPDGRRISYLSYTGYPTFSGNVAALDATNFKKKPVMYAMKNKSDCKKMVYHPVLDLTASPGGGSAVIYDATTGEPSADRLATTEALAGVMVHDLMFSASGTHLVLVVSKGGGPRYLQSVPLNLSAEERAAVRAGASAPATADTPADTKVQPEEMGSRTWTDASGKHHIKAELQRVEGDDVLLKKTDGTLLRIPIKKLSEADQEFVEKRR
jgi:hypothetical protein